MISIPRSCPRGRTDCIALARIESDDGNTFFCCGENDGTERLVKQDNFTVCFKGPHRDDINFYDKRDLAHQAAVLTQTLAAVERAAGEDRDWSPWPGR
ncbi:MAG: hypothetical protein NUW01_17425 [Gemmatimonadaceae bacterium]|nr:hypothetical protein [Gemmatimonadaceae bacterium]